MIERFFGALEYERPYRHDISDGVVLAAHVSGFRTVYNSIRPHEAISMARPLGPYRRPPRPNFPTPNLSQILDTGQVALARAEGVEQVGPGGLWQRRPSGCWTRVWSRSSPSKWTTRRMIRLVITVGTAITRPARTR